MKFTAAPPADTTPAAPVTADYLAWLRAKSVAAGIVAASVLAGGGLVVDATGLAVVLFPFAAVAIVLVVYGVYLWRHVDSTVRDLWQREVKDGKDYNHDTYVGDPFNNVRVQGSNGAADETVIIPKPSNSAKSQPIMEGWGVSAADLVAFAFEAETSRGLKETAWVGKGVSQFVLPSGKAVTQKRLREIQAALAEHDMASKPDGKWRMDWTAQRIAERLADNLK